MYRNYVVVDVQADRFHNDIEKEVRSDRRKEYNKMLREQHIEDQIIHFKRQREILLRDLDNAKTDAERFQASFRLENNRKNLAKCEEIAAGKQR